MSNNYIKLERELNMLENIEDWNEKIEMMKTLKTKIGKEQERLSELINIVSKDDIKEELVNKLYDNIKTENDNNNLKLLIEQFEKSTNIEEKISLFNNINIIINKIEKQLFN